MVCALGLLLGCSPVGSMRGHTEPALNTTVEIDRSVLWLSDEVLIRVTVANPHSFPVLRRFPTGCKFGYRFEDHAGEIVAKPQMKCTMAPTEREWAPGEVIVREFRWSWKEDRPAPGAYLLFGGLGMRGFGDTGRPVEVLFRAGKQASLSTGFRTATNGFLTSIRVDKANFASLHGTPEFEAIVAEVRRRNEEKGEAGKSQ